MFQHVVANNISPTPAGNILRAVPSSRRITLDPQAGSGGARPVDQAKAVEIERKDKILKANRARARA